MRIKQKPGTTNWTTPIHSRAENFTTMFYLLTDRKRKTDNVYAFRRQHSQTVLSSSSVLAEAWGANGDFRVLVEEVELVGGLPIVGP